MPFASVVQSVLMLAILVRGFGISQSDGWRRRNSSVQRSAHQAGVLTIVCDTHYCAEHGRWRAVGHASAGAATGHRGPGLPACAARAGVRLRAAEAARG